MALQVPNALSSITLRWMVREAKELTSIAWEDEVLKMFRVERPKDGTQEMDEYIDQEKADAVSELHSAFRSGFTGFLWCLLEFLPIISGWTGFWGVYFYMFW